MNLTPKVSVIIATYNRADYLRQAIASVLAQSYPDFELLVVDDGSTDDTAAAVAEFTDARIVYLHQTNAGRSAARNLGLTQARGMYVAFLDDDDLYLPHKLAVQTNFLDDHPEIGLVAGGSQIIAADGTPIRVRESRGEQPRLALPACLYACPLLTCAVLFRRNWLAALEHWFDPEMERAEDTDFWLRLLLAGCVMAWTPQIVSAYRQHPDNSQGDGERYARGYLRLLDKLYARADLPAVLHAERPALYAHYHMVGACHAYAAGQIASGQQWLRLAAEAAPETTRGAPPPIVSSLVGVAQNGGAEDPAALINVIFRHLPSEMEKLRPYRHYALSALPMQRVFAARAANARPRFRDWLRGVYHYPRWLANRGVWSILLRDVVLRLPAVRSNP